MENNMQIFNYNSNQVRTVEINGEPWFVLKDVCSVFGVVNDRNVSSRLDSDEKVVHTMDTLGGSQGMVCVNESGLYNALFSMKPKKSRGVTQEYIDKRIAELKAFKRWVTHDILPSVRKNGVYATNDFVEKALNDPDFAIQTFQKLKEERQMRRELEQKVEVQTKQIEEMKPKVTYYDKILNSKSLVSVTEIAKDYGMGAVTLNKILAQKKIQYKVNRTWVLYDKYDDKGYTGTKTCSFSSSEGYDCSRESTYWTQKGRMFIYDLLKKDGMIPVMEREENQ